MTLKEITAIDAEKENNSHLQSSASTTERSSFRSPQRSAGLKAEAAAALTSMGQSFPERRGQRLPSGY